MGTKTGIITFNVTDRGRKHRGKDRNFDTAALAAMVNGGDVQERVKMGDMLGYYGHWPRVKFGMNPAEGGIVAGKAVSVEPAVRTTYIKAMPDGTIEYEAEFLDTAAGKLAERLHKSKAGGFSSAIDIRNAGAKQLPTGFYGFDYVLEPNFTTNRGYALDGVNGEELLLDEVAEYNALIEAQNAILDSMQSDYEKLKAAYDRALDSVARLSEENEVLYSKLASGKTSNVALDSLTQVVFGHRQSRFDDADDFLSARLEPFQKVKEETLDSAPDTSAAESMNERRFGR